MKNQNNVLKKGLQTLSLCVFLGAFNAVEASNSLAWPEIGVSSSIDKELSLKLPSGKTVIVSINSEKIIEGRYFYLGRVASIANSLFEAEWNNGELKGKLQFIATKEAYSISQTKNAPLNITTLDSDLEFCEKHAVAPPTSFVAGAQPAPPAVPQGVDVRALQSNPGAKGVIYLHLNGTTIPANSYWSNSYNSGNAFSVLATTMSNQAIYNLWLAMKEDYAPFQLNITTDSTIYNAQSAGNRFRLIVTPTSDKFAALSNTGIAPIDGYSGDYDAFCFPSGFFGETDAYMLGEVCSHEIGHAVGLRHDGGTGTGYYSGHGASTERSRLWGPIMGSTYRTQVSQWSKGEYSGANNTEDDLSIISGNNFGYRLDDHAGVIGTATVLGVNASDSVVSNNTGIIEKNTDIDMFSFTTTGGQVDLSFKPVSYKPNLKVQVELLDSLGNLVSTHVRTDGALDASLSKQLSAGRYYIKLDGVGHLTVNTGYSDYGSIGQYTIEGTYPTNGAVVVLSSAVQSSSQAQSSSQGTSSSSAGIDCSSYPVWQSRSYDWSATKEYVTYQGSAYSHTSWASSTVPDQNTSWLLEGVCQVANSSSSMSSAGVSSSNAVSSSSVGVSSIASSSIANLSSSGALSSSVQNVSSSNLVGVSSSDVTTSIQNYQMTWSGNILRFENSSNLEVEVYSLQGHKQKVTLEQSENSIQLNLNQLNTGLWIVRTKQAGKVNLHKVLLP